MNLSLWRSSSSFTNADKQFIHAGVFMMTSITEKETEPLGKCDTPFLKTSQPSLRNDQNVPSQAIKLYSHPDP